MRRVGLLCEYFIAPTRTDAAETIDWSGGPAVPRRAGRIFRRQSGEPFPTVSLPGVEPTMWTSKLEELMTGHTLEEMLANQAFDVVVERDHGQRLVVSLSPDLQAALDRVDDGLVPDIAARWAETDSEYGTGGNPDLAQVALIQLVALARSATQRGWSWYCWVSV